MKRTRPWVTYGLYVVPRAQGTVQLPRVEARALRFRITGEERDQLRIRGGGEVGYHMVALRAVASLLARGHGVPVFVAGGGYADGDLHDNGEESATRPSGIAVWPAAGIGG